MAASNGGSTGTCVVPCRGRAGFTCAQPDTSRTFSARETRPPEFRFNRNGVSWQEWIALIYWLEVHFGVRQAKVVFGMAQRFKEAPSAEHHQHGKKAHGPLHKRRVTRRGFLAAMSG